jgi:hypothetical protein
VSGVDEALAIRRKIRAALRIGFQDDRRENPASSFDVDILRAERVSPDVSERSTVG